MLRRGTENNQRQPLVLRVCGGVVETFTDRTNALEIMVFVQVAIASRQFLGFKQPHLKSIQNGLFLRVRQAYFFVSHATEPKSSWSRCPAKSYYSLIPRKLP